jgi:predicted transcriptional regulator
MPKRSEKKPGGLVPAKLKAKPNGFRRQLREYAIEADTRAQIERIVFKRALVWLAGDRLEVHETGATRRKKLTGACL